MKPPVVAATVWALVALAATSALPVRADADGDLATVIAQVRAHYGDVPRISTADLAAWLGDRSRVPPQLLDVREPEEYAVSHLAGAVRVSPDARTEDVLAQVDRRRPVVVYCSVGYRSAKLARRLRAAGLANVANLEGSIFAWANEDRPLERDGRPVRTVHPYSSRWGKLLKPEHRAP